MQDGISVLTENFDLLVVIFQSLELTKDTLGYEIDFVLHLSAIPPTDIAT